MKLHRSTASENSSPDRPRPQWRRPAGVGVAVLSAVGFCGWLVMRAHSDAAAAASEVAVPPLVSILAPRLREVPTSVTLTGLIDARNDVPIGNEGDPARITAVLIEAGSRVRKGQVLARLSSIAAQSQVDNAEASLAETRANAAMAQAESARAQQGPDLFSKEEIGRRRAAALAALAKVLAAEAQVTDARNRLAHTVITAPADGIVLTRTAEVGQIAVPGVSVLFHLARDGQIEMRGQVAEVDVPQLAVGQKANVRLAGVARTFTGTIWQVGAVIDPATRQGSVRIALPAGERDLRPGAFAHADILVGRTLGAILPQTAVQNDDRGTYVLIVGKDSKVERQAVRVAGMRSGGLLISGGLAGTERVVAVAGAFLRTGQLVSVASSDHAGPT